jgi:light-regulated signal transduction histidine kinase (bacteriophytochrome)
MGRIIIDIDEQREMVRRVGRSRRGLKIAAAVLAAFVTIAGIGGFVYWQSLKSTPQYTLALLIDAARRNDQGEVNRIVNIDAVVDDFIPQITDKAVEMYGRGLPPKTIGRVATVAAPVMPAVKDRAKSELPKAIRDRTGKFEYIPFPAIVLGAGRYLDITVDGDEATVKSKQADRPLEVTMKRDGGRWQIVAVKDEQLATKIAKQIGQEIIAVASNGGTDGSGAGLGIRNLQELLRQAGEVLK